MKGTKKTKDQLIQELEKLRRRVRGLEKKDAERKQLLAALKESEFKYFTLVDQARDIVVIVQDGVYQFANRAIEVSGYRVEEIIGRPFEFLVNPSQRDEMKMRHRNRIDDRPVPASYEATMLCKDGSTLDFEISINSIQYEGEKAVLGIGRNITERKQAENALRESEAKYAAVVEHAQDMVLVVQDGLIRYVNPAVERFGARREDLLGRPFLELVAPESAEPMKVRHESRLRGGAEPSHYEIQLTNLEGQLLDLDISSNVIQYEGEQAVLSIIRDVTERRRAHQALRESEERYRSLFENSRDAIFLADAESGQIMEANAAAVQLIGMPVEQIIGLHQTELHPPDEEKYYRAIFAEHVNSGKAITTDIFIQRPDGKKVPVDISAAKLEVGGRKCVLGVFRDMTDHKVAEQERQKLQAQMQHAQKLESLGVLAGGIAHDFNNLLMGVLGNASLALLELPDWSRARPHVEKIEKTSQHAAELTKQMLAYSGKGKFVVQDVEISSLVEEMTDLLKVSISKKASLDYQFEKNLPPFEADATQIRQVIMNLITNASDAIGDKSGVITLSTGVMEADRAYLSNTYLDEDLPAGSYVYLEVSDSGSGMDPATQVRIFDPFFSSKFTGRGLGLAAVLGIVRGHKGAISVYSEPGKGTTFKVLFPVKEPAAEPEMAEQEESWAPSTGKTILIVDDEATVRDVAKNMLESFEYKVLLAKDGQEGVEVFRQNQEQIAAVLLDYTMPTMDGVETFRELRRIQPGVRVILSSGYNELDATHRFTGKGLAGFIQKPYRLSQLIDKVREVLEKT